MTRAWMKEYESFRDSGEAWGLDLRLSFADIIIKRLRRKGWTQRQLADRLGVREPVISRLVHAEMNCTFDTAGRVLHALGVKADLVEPDRIIGDSAFTTLWTVVETEPQPHGQKEEDTEDIHEARITDTSPGPRAAWAETGESVDEHGYAHSVG